MIPPWIASRFRGLFILVLAGNLLEGTIPPSIWQMDRWQQPYPSSDPKSDLFRQFNFNFAYFTIYSKGIRQSIQAILFSFTMLDLSDNNLHGGLPEQVFNLSGLVLLNLSSNHFSGEIPSVSSNLSQIDLSCNNLTGGIPPMTLAGSNLEYLDLSNNKLCGPIPNLATKFAKRAFTGNPCLCGEPLDINCPTSSSPLSPSPMSSQSFDEKTSLISWIGFSVGFVCSFLVVIIVFLFTSRGSYFIFGDKEPLMHIRRHGLYKEPM